MNASKFAVFGAGSIGCYVGGCLLNGGYQTEFIGRERMGKTLDEHGLNISDWQDRNFHINPSDIVFNTNPDSLTDVNVIFVAVKSGDSESVAHTLSQIVHEQTVVVSLQNGVHNTEIFRQHLPNNEVLAGMVAFNVVNQGDGQFHCGTEGEIALEKSTSSASIRQALVESGIQTIEYQDIQAIQWTKLIMNLNNAVNALSGEPLLTQLHNPEYRAVMAKVIAEALALMNHKGIKTKRVGKVIPKLLPFILQLPTWAFKRVASAMLKIDPHARSSMYEDLTNGRRTEIDYLNGEIVKLGKLTGLGAPMNEHIVNLVKEAETAGKGSPCLPARKLTS